ncbi:MAG: DMT family transporter [Candidatus Krumholzibacteria bacterium]|nr:DMT family transporter [Candidatus Krumholzibacteria bacterium]
MKPGRLKSESLLLVSAVIWGFAFVAQRAAMRDIGPFLFNGVRFALGAVALLPLALRASRRAGPGTLGFCPRSARWGIAAGALIFCGASFQQVGIVYTTAGRAGFITGLYVILVPILGLAVGRRTGAGTWAGAAVAAAGLYLLSFTGPLEIAGGDLLVLAGTIFWALHVLLIATLSVRVAPLVTAVIQFSACSLLSLAAAILTEDIAAAGLADAALPVLYGGLLSVGVAYTLQIVGQRSSPPGHAAIILSLETVFAVLGGWIVLSETIPARGIAGCILMLAGIVMSQWNVVRARAAVSRAR